MKRNITLGITGASGIPIAFKLIYELITNSSCIVHLIITTAGIITIKQETGISLSVNPQITKRILIEKLQIEDPENLIVYTNQDWYAPQASGSSVFEDMVICPCSMATLAKIATGISEDLLTRASDVIIKERKNLIIVPRESPLSVIHLNNLLTLAKLGVSILPPVPAFYTFPQTIEDIINFIVSRILDQLKIPNKLILRWSHEDEAKLISNSPPPVLI